jgi:hypothetical protein
MILEAGKSKFKAPYLWTAFLLYDNMEKASCNTLDTVALGIKFQHINLRNILKT